ncbi:MAG: T9SS type A sorting domain-containing protein [Flavobacterium sp.]
MKKLYILSLMLMCTVAAFAQTIYSENMGPGNGGTNPNITTYNGLNVWQNGTSTGITYSGTASVRVSNASTPTTTFSGAANIFFSANSTQDFIISGLNTASYPSADLVLTFGLRQDAGETGGSAQPAPATSMVVEQSTDAGNTWTAVPYTRTAASSAAWEMITVSGGIIPSSATLSLRFRQSGATASRIDDVKLAAVSASCTFNFGTPTSACNATTLNMDATTVTIPFTGGGNVTYNLSSTAGTIGGDNPSSMASGNITLTLTEGGTATLTVVGGTCNKSINLAAPSCKPVNTLPFVDNFNYTVGTSLNDSQSWTIVNTGDNVTAIAGNLNYTGITPAGNSVSFSGTGAESYAPFTETTTGTVYTSFLMNVTDMTNVTTDGAEAYFIALMTGTSTSSSNARLWVKKEGTGYKLSLASGTAAGNYTTATYNVGDTLLIIIGYDFTANALKLWVNPTVSTFSAATAATITDTPSTAPTNFGGILIRQDGATNTPTITIDEMRVGTDVNQVLSSKSFDNNISGLKLYPNPLSGNVLNVTSNSSADKTIAVYDVLGKNVLNATVTNETVNVSGLTSGVYIVKITEEGKTATRKLVVK